MKILHCSNVLSNHSVRSQFCTCYDSWAVVACAKLLPDLIIIIHVRTTDLNELINCFSYRIIVYLKVSAATNDLGILSCVTESCQRPYHKMSNLEAISSSARIMLLSGNMVCIFTTMLYHSMPLAVCSVLRLKSMHDQKISGRRTSLFIKS